jgi:flagellar motor protein MotB
VLTLLFVAQKSQAQKGSRNARSLNAAEKHFQNREFKAAIPLFQHHLLRNPANGHAWMLLGECGLETNDTSLALTAFSNALKADSVRFVRAWAIMGEIYLNKGQYKLAVSAFSKANGSSGFRENERQLLQAREQLSRFRLGLVSDPRAVELVNIGPTINTASDEFPNSILLDGSLMLFTRKQAEAGRDGAPAAETFMLARRSEIGWALPTEFVPWQSDKFNMGAPALSPDGNVLWFTGCGWQGGLGSCDIYVSHLQDGRWSLPINAGLGINSTAWDSQPAISADGQILIFSSNRAGGFGGSDLYRSVKLPDGTWSRPENLGSLINTAGNEMAPFFHPDGSTMYFSSDGHPGMGGYDLFMTRLDVAGRWLQPTNLGFPINTKFDEMNMITDALGHQAWIAAARGNNTYGGYDIYTFSMPLEIRPQPMRTIRIVVSDAVSKLPVRAQIKASGLADGSLLFEGQSRGQDGQALFSLPQHAEFSLFVGKEGYLFFSENYSFPGDTGGDLLDLYVKLQPVEVQQPLLLHNVNFEFNSARLLDTSLPALRNLLVFLRQNPELVVEIGGHTDSIGSSAFNQRLSLQRALAVKSWLVEQGISENRISAVGYGATRPLSPNTTEEGRALNRRTEMRIVQTGNGIK